MPTLEQKCANYDEFIIGLNHPTLDDTHNRDMLIDHDIYGGHTYFSVTTLENNTGGSRSAGDVVVLDFDNTNAFTTPGASDVRPALVVLSPNIPVDDTGYLALMGIAVVVSVAGSVTAGHYLRPSSTPYKAEDAGATPSAGCFARARSSGSGSVVAIMGPAAMFSEGIGGGSGSGSGSGSTTVSAGGSYVFDAAFSGSSSSGVGTGPQTLYSKAIAGNTLRPNQAFRIMMSGTIEDSSSGAAGAGPMFLTLRVNFGGATFLAFTCHTSDEDSASTRRSLGGAWPFHLSGWIQNRGTTSSQSAGGYLDAYTVVANSDFNGEISYIGGVGGGLAAGVAVTQYHSQSGSSGSIDTTTSQTLSITAEWSQHGTVAGITVHSIVVEQIGAGSSITTLDTSSGDTAVSNTIAETTVFSTTVPGGVVGSEHRLRLTSQCSISDSNGTNNGTLTFKVKFGSTTLATLVWTTGTGGTEIGSTKDMMLEVLLSGKNSTTSQLATIQIIGPYPGLAYKIADIASGTSSEDSSVNKAFTVTAQWSGAGVTRVFTARHQMLEVLSAV